MSEFKPDRPRGQYEKKVPLPEIELHPEDEGKFESEIIELAYAIYDLYQTRYESGKELAYNPYAGGMMCGVITDKIIAFCEDQGLVVERVCRYYRILDPNGEYNDSFGHVYLIINNGEEKILVDATYLQFVEKKNRDELPPVLIIRFRDQEEFRQKFSQVPIKRGMVVPFYLGFNSPEAQEYFKDSKFTVYNDDVAQLDDTND